MDWVEEEETEKLAERNVYTDVDKICGLLESIKGWLERIAAVLLAWFILWVARGLNP